MLIASITVLAMVIAFVVYLTADILWLLPVVFALSWLVLTALAFAFLWYIAQQVDKDAVQEHDDPFYREMVKLYVPALVWLVKMKVHTRGLEKTPKSGRFMLVCNHLFMADPGVILAHFPNSQLAFISMQENRDMPIIGSMMHKIMCQTLDRDNDRQALKVILKCIDLLKQDEVSIGVFPEGYTAKDGKLHPFRSGVFKIAQKANVPIVVCTIQGTRPVFHNLKKLKTTHVQLHLVDVIPAENLKGRTAVDIANQVYDMMLSDLGEEFRYIEPETEQNT